jgi:glycine cleavage system protein P-like pyridoxal-binding family
VYSFIVMNFHKEFLGKHGGGAGGAGAPPSLLLKKKFAGRLVITVREKSNSAELLAAFGC